MRPPQEDDTTIKLRISQENLDALMDSVRVTEIQLQREEDHYVLMLRPDMAIPSPVYPQA